MGGRGIDYVQWCWSNGYVLIAILKVLIAILKVLIAILPLKMSIVKIKIDILEVLIEMFFTSFLALF